MKSARSEAPYLPSNIQYIANNNALDSKEDVSGDALACARHTLHALPLHALPYTHAVGLSAMELILAEHRQHGRHSLPDCHVMPPLYLIN
jgi:hypothetical protein